MRSYVYVEHQLGFSSTETIRAKQSFDKLALEYGVIVENYLEDNDLFKASTLVQHLRDHNQRYQYCGVNIYHNNSMDERSIRTVL